MSWIAVGVAGATLVGSVVSSNAQQDAAESAANAQTQSAQLGIDEQRRQFDQVRQLLAPFAQAGTQSLGQQGTLAGLNGADAQRQAIEQLQTMPAFQSQLKLGENRILASASATGGLRGGNTQAALAYFAPQLLAQTINDQYGRLGGITSIGQNAAAGVGNAGMQTGNNVTQLLQGAGAAQAQAALAGGRATSNMVNGVTDAFGRYVGAGGGFGGGLPVPDSVQGQFAQTPAGGAGFGSGLAYGNQDLGLFL